MITLEATITCPQCGFASEETMATNACEYYYVCKHCGVLLKPKPGDCCVYCSYADVKCPSVQAAGPGCCASDVK